MSYKKVLSVQDISCFGQCSLTVALPIISACGVETCVLPSAVLSTHTGGFSGFTFTDLTEDMPKIKAHWEKENILFDCIYTGYLGSKKQIDYVKDLFSLLVNDGVKVVDPAMADNGKLYYGFDEAFAKEMASLCALSDYCLPNITEACFMTGVPYKETYDESYVKLLIEKLCELGCKNLILTGISYREGKTGVVVYENGKYSYYEHDKMSKGCHGTGDIYASAFVGALMNGKSAIDSAKISANYVVECIKDTLTEDNHWYGAKFEPSLYKLIEKVRA
ncbi:MAG: pyridoxamine kinase [Clostridia bacterium]|nr:pyridoxamine kinase [Clostridia bacterium]